MGPHGPTRSHCTNGPSVCLQTEIAKRAGYQVQSGGTNEIFYVKDVRSPEGKVHEVNLRQPNCCAYVIKHKQPCRHMVPVFHACGTMSTRRKTAEAIRKYWPKWAHADNYLHMYTGKEIRRPSLLVHRTVQGPSRRSYSGAVTNA